MRRTWLTSVAAALCVVVTSLVPVAASPAGMFQGARPTTKSTSGSWATSWKFWQRDAKTQPAFVTRQAAAPSEHISPLWNPVRYLSATWSETPIAAVMRRDKTTQSAPERHDQIALNTPTGPPTPQFFTAMAQMSERQGNIPQARRQFQQALSMWPNDVEVLRAAARMEDRQGQLPLAESLYQRAVATNPQHAGALNDLGLCLARQGKLQQSAQCIEQAIHLQPDKALYRNNAATVLVEMRQDQKALAHLSAVHGPAASNYNLGKLLVDRGRPHEALAYFQSAVELDPAMEPARAAIAQLHGTTVTPQSQIAVESESMPQPADRARLRQPNDAAATIARAELSRDGPRPGLRHIVLPATDRLLSDLRPDLRRRRRADVPDGHGATLSATRAAKTPRHDGPLAHGARPIPLPWVKDSPWRGEGAFPSAGRTHTRFRQSHGPSPQSAVRRWITTAKRLNNVAQVEDSPRRGWSHRRPTLGTRNHIHITPQALHNGCDAIRKAFAITML